ncbi:hypothetical protein HMPREF9019_1641 [Hoylesella timonensis CRIS 5C-B1]|uniref:Uncharacterized protein n=1 Tax=Hoylesella timonensis CRIS 5C-B1 TaxID=679189 RepID=D1W1P3_9BACT|nr:hypothetical protein HMPREF9019_1641 [Hoylesella timonensis CRIS 5C-B1]
MQPICTKNVRIDTSLCCCGSFFKNNLSIFLNSTEEIKSEINGKDGNGGVI